MGRNKPFTRIGPARIQRSAINLSHTKIFPCDAGMLIPVLCEDVTAGDLFRMWAKFLLRANPLVHPTMHEFNVYYHCFFVAYRLLDDRFEDFLTKGVTGDYEGTLQDYGEKRAPNETTNSHVFGKGTIWDYLGQQTVDNNNTDWLTKANRGFAINAFMKQAINFIYNEYFRDQNFIEPVNLNQSQILKCSWEKDYYTSALPEQQRGTSPAFPLGNQFMNVIATNRNSPPFGTEDLTGIFIHRNIALGETSQMIPNSERGNYLGFYRNGGPVPSPGPEVENQYLKVNTQNINSGFNINDLREAVQLQMWMERNQRAGVRFTEFLRAHFNVSPRDDRLDRPEYIGGSKTPIIFSEVLQTSSTTGQPSPQGTLAGHGISADSQKIGSYLVKEPGLIIGLMSVRPRTVYYQGVDKQYCKETPFDFIFPEFTHLSEQAIKKHEVYAAAFNDSSRNFAHNTKKWGFIPIYDHYRYRKNMICGAMRDTLNTWHLARMLSDQVELNNDFITMNGQETSMKRIFSVTSEPGFVIQWLNDIIAIRPIPAMGEPGLLDHS
jgi:hypothetical protein